MRVLETHGRLARRFDLDALRDALYNIVVGGGEREQRREGGDRCLCANEPVSRVRTDTPPSWRRVDGVGVMI